jgi:transposase InsO family protein
VPTRRKVNRQGRLRDIAAAKVTETDVPIMFTDLKGPIRTPGVHGELYYQAYMASHTKYVMCYFMQFKSSTVDTLKDLLEIQLPAEGSCLITYCADGAPELISRDIVRILSQHNCKIMYSPPYTHELNAVVERNHRTAFESGHAMFTDYFLVLRGQICCAHIQPFTYQYCVWIHEPDTSEVQYCTRRFALP